jgi:gluconolactonase
MNSAWISLTSLLLAAGCGSATSAAPKSAEADTSPGRAFSCPVGPYSGPTLAGTPMRVEGVPPPDEFNHDNADFTNIEGAVWWGGALYVSEINQGRAEPNQPPPSRVLKVTADGHVSVVIAADSGTNGMALDPAGRLVGAVHKDGSISRLSLTGEPATPLVTSFLGQRFDSPNDLTFHGNGTLYFTDPDYQAPTPRPQAATRAYRVPPGGQAVAIEELGQPNGITLSKAQDFLYIGGNQLRRYPVLPDGALGVGTPFGGGIATDGMVIDCADNLYAAADGVAVFDAAGTSLGTIVVSAVTQVTNVAFGGDDHKTLYITGQGSGTKKGLFKLSGSVPGFPY